MLHQKLYETLSMTGTGKLADLAFSTMTSVADVVAAAEAFQLQQSLKPPPVSFPAGWLALLGYGATTQRHAGSPVAAAMAWLLQQQSTSASPSITGIKFVVKGHKEIWRLCSLRRYDVGQSLSHVPMMVYRDHVPITFALCLGLCTT